MSETVVKVFIYDLTKGLARTMSLPLLGKQLDGVWHTGIVAYGQEFFYGGEGISSCPPCGTILGQPDQVVELGMTEIPLEMFKEYLLELSTSAYRPEQYNLFSHNCNTFSNDVANFLTGSSIPRYVTDLPQEVLNTPLGAMIKPFIDAMSVNPGGGQELFPASAGNFGTGRSTKKDCGAVQGATSTASCKDGSMSTTNGSTGEKVAAKSKSESSSDKTEDLIFYSSQEVLEKYKHNKEGILQRLSGDDARLLQEIHEYLIVPECDWSLGPNHVNLLGQALEGSAASPRERQLLSELLQLTCTKEDVVVMLKHDYQSTVFRILLQMNKYDTETQVNLLRAVCNICNHSPGLELLGDASEKMLNNQKTCHRKVTVDTCVASILHDNDCLNGMGAALAFNLMQSKVRGEVAMELGIALAQLCSKPLPDDDTADWALRALWKCMEVDPEVLSVVAVMGLDFPTYQNRSRRLQESSAKIAQALQ